MYVCIMEIKVIKPTDKEVNEDNYLIKQVIDKFNACVLSRDYDKHMDGYFVIELTRSQSLLKVVLDGAIKLINDNGWDARHGSHYSTRNACPSYGIFFMKK